MYTKSFLASALLIASAAATNHEVAAAAPVHQVAPAVHEVAPAAPVHQVAPPAPAVHQPAPVKHEQMAPPAMAPPPAKHEVAAAQPPMAHQALTVHLVAVGDNNGSLKYFPDTVHAMPGDVVQFQFHPKVSTSTITTKAPN
jgi:hypothetical protein